MTTHFLWVILCWVSYYSAIPLPPMLSYFCIYFVFFIYLLNYYFLFILFVLSICTILRLYGHLSLFVFMHLVGQFNHLNYKSKSTFDDKKIALSSIVNNIRQTNLLYTCWQASTETLPTESPWQLLHFRHHRKLDLPGHISGCEMFN